MSKEIVRPIYDTKSRILSKNQQTNEFDIYPYREGRVFFDRENQVVYTDIDGQRSARTDLSSIQVLNGNIQEFYERGAKGFENQILVGKTSTGFRLYYVDDTAQVHNLTFTAEEVGDLSQRAANESATFYYAGE
jgi:sugar lactone lactonase YvrE